MSLDNDWDAIRPGRYSRAADAGMGLLRITLLFGSAAIALALIAAPILDRQTQSVADGTANSLDMTSTGSIGHSTTYTLRKSVLQQYPGSVCVIRDNGRRSGDC